MPVPTKFGMNIAYR